MAKKLVLSAANRERVRELLDKYATIKAGLDRLRRSRLNELITLSITHERAGAGDYVDVGLSSSSARAALLAEFEACSKELHKLHIYPK
jgi:hypothetical protein